MSELANLDLTVLSAKLAIREISAKEILESCVRRIERFNPAFNVFRQVDVERARAQAKASADRKRRIGPLDGIPIAVKDNIDIAGLATRSGLGPRDERPADVDAEIIGRLRAAGAIILGHTNMHEGALGATNDNPHYGHTHNPWRHGWTPGGSSGGSAAAVAARMCPLALGTDTMGSVRLPAAYCGLVGFKPGWGRIANAGIEPLCRQLDQVGPMTRTVADLRCSFEIMTGLRPPAIDVDLRTIRIACLDSIDQIDLGNDVRAAFDDALVKLANADIHVSRIGCQGCDPGKARRRGLLMVEAEAASYYRPDREHHPTAFSGAFTELLDYGASVGEDRVVDAERVISDVGRRFDALFETVDLLIMPTAPQTAFAFAEPAPSNQADLTALANFAGAPAISLPIAASPEGLPVGIQIIGAKGTDSAVLSAAAALEEIFEFRLPDLPRELPE